MLLHPLPNQPLVAYHDSLVGFEGVEPTVTNQVSQIEDVDDDTRGVVHVHLHRLEGEGEAA